MAFRTRTGFCGPCCRVRDCPPARGAHPLGPAAGVPCSITSQGSVASTGTLAGRGRLRIYFGAAPGVGKTYAMLRDAVRERDRGTDVVAAWVETHGREPTAAQIDGLDVIAPRVVRHGGARLEELDLDAVLTRHPEMAVVDELAHTNLPGSRHSQRFEDVEEILSTGVNVMSTLNVQNVASLAPLVASLTGVHPAETVPDDFVRRADQIELIDIAPDALQVRLERGRIYPESEVPAALDRFFRAENLATLREMALRFMAARVADQVEALSQSPGGGTPLRRAEPVVVGIGGHMDAGLVWRAARFAALEHAELLGVHVLPPDGQPRDASPRLDEHRKALEALGGRYLEVPGDDIADALVATARHLGARDLILGPHAKQRLAWLRGASVGARVQRSAGGSIDVHILGDGNS